jgi:uncharacterized protein (DUF433 family)
MDDPLLARIVTDARTMAGKPVIRGTRLTVGLILNLLGHGMKSDEILVEYPGLTEEDISACLLFASQSVDDQSFVPLAETA